MIACEKSARSGDADAEKADDRGESQKPRPLPIHCVQRDLNGADRRTEEAVAQIESSPARWIPTAWTSEGDGPKLNETDHCFDGDRARGPDPNRAGRRRRDEDLIRSSVLSHEGWER